VAEFHDPDDTSPVTGTTSATNPDGSTNLPTPFTYPDIVRPGNLFLCAGNDVTVTPNGNGPCGSATSGDADDCACPQAPATPATPTTPPATINPAGIGVLVKASGYFKNNPTQAYPVNAYYAADSYDVSPQLANGTSLAGRGNGTYNYVVRYQPSWTTISENLDCNTAPASGGIAAIATPTGLTPGLCTGGANLYLNQMRWRNPPGSAYVTSTTWHVNGAGSNVMVLSEDGEVQKFDANRFVAMEAPGNGALTVNSNGVCTADFWQVTHP
jgi:hypothetical protein